jgi:hypothetical protein
MHELNYIYGQGLSYGKLHDKWYGVYGLSNQVGEMKLHKWTLTISIKYGNSKLNWPQQYYVNVSNNTIEL